jgi:hypothetical protein
VKVLASVLLAVCSVLILSSAGGADVPDRPDGVAENAWISINYGLGLVVERERPPARTGTDLRGVPTVEGYFAVKRQGRWWRLEASRQSSYVPTSDSR